MTGAASDIVASRRRRRGSDFDVAAVLVVVVVPAFEREARVQCFVTFEYNAVGEYI